VGNTRPTRRDTQFSVEVNDEAGPRGGNTKRLVTSSKPGLLRASARRLSLNFQNGRGGWRVCVLQLIARLHGREHHPSDTVGRNTHAGRLKGTRGRRDQALESS